MNEESEIFDASHKDVPRSFLKTKKSILEKDDNDNKLLRNQIY